MNEVQVSTPVLEAPQDLHKAQEAFKDEVAAGNASDAERLGHLAARHEIHADASGVVMTKREHQAELSYRQEQGHPSDETVTKI